MLPVADKQVFLSLGRHFAFEYDIHEMLGQTFLGQIEINHGTPGLQGVFWKATRYGNQHIFPRFALKPSEASDGIIGSRKATFDSFLVSR